MNINMLDSLVISYENKGCVNLKSPVTIESTIKELETLPPRERQSTKQRKFFSEISVALLRRELERLIDKKDWLAGAIMSASMLEFAGKTLLLWKQSSASKKEIERIYQSDFATTIKQLLKHKIINKSIYNKMEENRSARNKAAHEILYQVALSLENKPNATLHECITNAIEIIDFLFSQNRLDE